MILKTISLPYNKDEQIRITIAEMARLTREGWWSSAVRELADKAIVGHFSTDGQLEALSDLVRGSMEFRFDPHETELVRVAEVMAREILYRGKSWGDCDDYSILLASMLGSLGFVPGFITMATRLDNPEYRHVFVAVALETGTVFLDPSVQKSYDTGDLRVRIWWISGERPARV